jgi:hypothetical protein
LSRVIETNSLPGFIGRALAKPIKRGEWGGRWIKGMTCYTVRPNGALHVLASVNNGAPISDGHSATPAQGLIRIAPLYRRIYRGGKPRA